MAYREEDTCGLHTIANALSLALGIDPTEISYDETAMREHLSVQLPGGGVFDDVSAQFPITSAQKGG